MDREVVIVAAKRSAIGSFMGSLKNTSALEISRLLISSLLNELHLDPSLIDCVIIGNVLQTSLGQNLARQALLKSGIPKEKSAFMVNMVCGSGLKAIQEGANSIRLNDSDIVIVGGVENMSLSPHVLEKSRFGYKMGNTNIVDSMIKDGLWCAINDYHMGITAENLAKKYNISRQQQDEFAYNSHIKAANATKEGKFAGEILPIEIKDKKSSFIFKEDEFIRPDTNLDSLSRLKAAFMDGGSVTAGNSSGVNDGGAMLILTHTDKAKELNLPILARIKGFANVGVDPSIMGIGAAFAARAVCDKLGLKLADIELFEANEAFAAQSLASLQELQKDSGLNLSNKVNIYGGAIALGHPIGASGARILITLLNALRQEGKNLGLATLCIGGGQGISAVIETC